MEVKRNSKGEKLYPFSMVKYGHNIELAYNHQWLICREMEDHEREWDDKAFEWLDTLSEVYASAMGHMIYWATGKEYGVLKEASVWAECYRDRRNA